jgi:hypothetical protein
VKTPTTPSKVTIDISGTQSTDPDCSDDEIKEQEQVRTIKNFLTSFNNQKDKLSMKTNCFTVVCKSNG